MLLLSSIEVSTSIRVLTISAINRMVIEVAKQTSLAGICYNRKMKRLTFNDVTPPPAPIDKAEEILAESKDKLVKIALLITLIVVLAKYWLA